MSLPRVLIADDHRLFADGVTHVLADRFDVVGIIADGGRLVDAVAQLRPDVVLLDMSMPNVNGLEALAMLMAERPGSLVVVLTMHRDARLAFEAFRGGAVGFILKESSGDELLTALGAVLRGERFLTSSLAKEVLAMASGPVPAGRVTMTRDEREVLRLIVQGQRVAEIAAALALSPCRVESVKLQMMRDLNVHSTAELVRYAVQNELVAL